MAFSEPMRSESSRTDFIGSSSNSNNTVLRNVGISSNYTAQKHDGKPTPVKTGKRINLIFCSRLSKFALWPSGL